MAVLVHLHAEKWECRTECGKECGTRETTAYRHLDRQRVTCTECLRRASPEDEARGDGDSLAD